VVVMPLNFAIPEKMCWVKWVGPVRSLLERICLIGLKRAGRFEIFLEFWLAEFQQNYRDTTGYREIQRPSCYSCIRVNTLKSTTDAAIEKLLEILEKGSSAVCSNTALDPLKAGVQSGPISKCQLPGLDYVLFVRGSGPHSIDYKHTEDKPLKEVIVSRKCAEAVLRGAQVYVPGVLACSAHVENGDVVAVSVAVEQAGLDGGWGTGITRGTILQGLQTGKKFMVIFLFMLCELTINPHFYERNGLYIGQGTTMMSRAGMFRVLEGVAVAMSNRVFTLASFNDVLKGEIFLQNLPSIITAHALDPQQGERILDMCAAPGGKTTAIAMLMKDKGEVVAVDRSHNKVLDIQKLAAEMGLNCITTCKLDALKAVRQKTEPNDRTSVSSIEAMGSTSQNSGLLNLETERSSSVAGEALDTNTTSENICKCLVDLDSGHIAWVGLITCASHEQAEQAKQGTYTSKAELRKIIRRLKNGPGRHHSSGNRVQKSEGFLPNSFDRVLLDAPCSALGLRPRLFAGEESLESLKSHATYQKRMFDQAVQLVRSGGVIVYSTCTINPGENESLVRYALDTYKFLSLASQHPRVGGAGLVGSCKLPNGYIEEWLRHGEENLVQRFDPSSPLDTIGFFIAKFNVGPKDT
ncbi:hypothetical protein RJ640_017738, partial [Escallonia rubra]